MGRSKDGVEPLSPVLSPGRSRPGLSTI